VALVVVSLWTAPEPADKLASFFGRLQTSSDETGVAAASATPKPLLLVNVLRLRQAAGGLGWRAYREDLGGFALGWALVVALVALTAAFLAM
jgi:hypothetical protein